MRQKFQVQVQGESRKNKNWGVVRQKFQVQVQGVSRLKELHRRRQAELQERHRAFEDRLKQEAGAKISKLEADLASLQAQLCSQAATLQQQQQQQQQQPAAQPPMPPDARKEDRDIMAKTLQKQGQEHGFQA